MQNTQEAGGIKKWKASFINKSLNNSKARNPYQKQTSSAESSQNHKVVTQTTTKNQLRRAK